MIGEKIRNLRKDNRISQEELAEKLSVSSQSVSLWENGQTAPSIENIVAIANIFNVSTDELLKENNNVPAPINNKDTPRKSYLNKKWIVAIFSVIVLISIVLAVLILFQPFSKNTLAMANAEKSVVKIYCYDTDGNESTTGSGFIMFEENICVTNYHVLKDAHTFKISTNEDITISASGIIACSKEKDIAIVKLQEETELKSLSIGDSDKVKKGETVIAIGSPLGIKNTISQGILSGRLMFDNMDVLQITAPISAGSSGGALFDDSGKVVGVTFASYEDGQNLNLAIPINEVKSLYEKARSLKDANYIFSESHPEYEYIEKYSQMKTISVSDLKSNPKVYDGELIKLIASVSSLQYDEKSPFLADKDYISGNSDSDWYAYYTMNFEKYPMIFTTYDYGFNEYIQEGLSVGDTVVIVGWFYYTEKGEETLEFSDEPFVSKPAPHSAGRLKVKCSYYFQ